MGRMSVATISDPEFINLQPVDVNPMMSKCEIKVLYIGQNRNGSYIDKDVASDMAKTLRGAPIVGWYNEDKQDFVDHGDRITIDGDGIKFETLTKPYGFVSPNAEVWFQDFEDTDEFGNKTTRTYLMTTGYLWTGQYEEAKLAIDEGRPQSMELDDETLDGHWAKDSKSGYEFFIINDAIFSKLCILGEDVEPCFEGANITSPEVSTSFTLDDDFKHTLYNMMEQLKFALEEEGGNQMGDPMEEKVDVEETFAETGDEEPVVEKVFAEEDKTDETVVSDFDNSTEGTESQSTGETSYAVDEEKYAELETQFNELQEQYTALQNEYQTLVDFKNQVETEKKQALIDSFYMLSEDDKKDVVANMSKYSLDEIEAKLSVICVRKKVNFNLEDDDASKKEDIEQSSPITTFSLDGEAESSTPAWITALRNTKNNRNN